ALLGDHLYVAGGVRGLTVIDVGDPTAPIAVGTCSLSGYAQDVALRWPFAYVASLDHGSDPGGLSVVDVSDPAAPLLAAMSEVRCEPVAVAVSGTYVHVVAAWQGLLTFYHESPVAAAPSAVLRLLPNHPNPFNPRTTIAFDLPTAANVGVSVYDVAGRRVRVLIDGTLASGRHKVIWDGRDDRGRDVGAGVYLYQLRSGARRESRSMALVR
ncbi:MAG: FlgD immunoglobulin-like domain containing protein, partial [Candidatus Krumholzibacteria bacterium]|nr:FlgD immunoglobulin-like domain containing protein [Candidatus Krumholzibacteria bacterium]